MPNAEDSQRRKRSREDEDDVDTNEDDDEIEKDDGTGGEDDSDNDDQEEEDDAQPEEAGGCATVKEAKDFVAWCRDGDGQQDYQSRVDKALGKLKTQSPHHVKRCDGCEGDLEACE